MSPSTVVGAVCCLLVLFSTLSCADWE